MERNFETVMIEQCAPVLASLKPAGLFRYETSDCADLARRVRSWNEQLGEKGLCVRVLKGCAQGVGLRDEGSTGGETAAGTHLVSPSLRASGIDGIAQARCAE